MQDFSGMYMWHYVSNENKIKGPKENRQYLVCYESSTREGSVWKMLLAIWYEKGARINLMDSKGASHKFDIKEDGFYIVNEFDAQGGLFFRIPSVRYWTAIPEPGVNPDDVLTVV